MGYFGKSFEDKEAAREIRKQNKLKKKGIKVNERDGSAADERNMLKAQRQEKIGDFFNTVSNARKRSFSNKMDRKIIKAETKNTIAQIEGHENVAGKNTARAMDIQIMREGPGLRKDLQASALQMNKIKNPQQELKKLSSLTSADNQAVMSNFKNTIKSGMTNIIQDGIKEHLMSDKSDFTTDLRQTDQEKSDIHNKYITGKSAPYNREKTYPGQIKK